MGYLNTWILQQPEEHTLILSALELYLDCERSTIYKWRKKTPQRYINSLIVLDQIAKLQNTTPIRWILTDLYSLSQAA